MKSLLSEKMTLHVKAIGADKKRQTRTQQEAIGAVLTELRVKRGWSQRKLADFSATTRPIFFNSKEA